jgi:sorting nexin-25
LVQGLGDVFNGPSLLDLVTHKLGQQAMLSEEGDEGEEFSSTAQAGLMGISLPGEFEVGPGEVGKLTEPVIDLFTELFELKEKNNWLRRQAVVLILQQLMGGILDRCVCQDFAIGFSFFCLTAEDRLNQDIRPPPFF